jgi:glycine cleavage system H protein
MNDNTYSDRKKWNMTEKEIKVSEQHVWVSIEDRHVHLGLTNYIQGALGAVISVELPDVGDPIEAGEIFAEIESVSTVHEFISPVSGVVLTVNPQLEEHPSIINEDPYNEGWLVEVRLKDDSELEDLMDMDEYYHFVFKDKS